MSNFVVSFCSSSCNAECCTNIGQWSPAGGSITATAAATAAGSVYSGKCWSCWYSNSGFWAGLQLVHHYRFVPEFDWCGWPGYESHSDEQPPPTNATTAAPSCTATASCTAAAAAGLLRWTFLCADQCCTSILVNAWDQ